MVLGIAGAYYLTKHATKYGIALLAGFGMLSLSFIIVPLLGINGIDHSNEIKLALYTVFASVGFFGAAKFSDGIQVFVTAFIGSYFFVRGISFYAGGFINEFDLTKGEGEEIKIEPIFYGYLAGIFVMFIVGVAVQKKLMKHKEDQFTANETDEEKATPAHPLG